MTSALSAPAKTRSATWDDYLTQLANPELEDCRVFFSNGSLWFEMGNEKKRLYAAMGILEYWVIDVRGRQIWAFQLVDGRYEDCQISRVLTGLPIELLSETS
jgi:hypothetical protein